MEIVLFFFWLNEESNQFGGCYFYITYIYENTPDAFISIDKFNFREFNFCLI